MAKDKPHKGKKEDKQPGKNAGEKKGGMITDKRFSKANYDPRFAVSDENERLEVDTRFSKMFTDPTFNQSYTIDKYGRKIKDKNAASNDLKKLYKLDKTPDLPAPQLDQESEGEEEEEPEGEGEIEDYQQEIEGEEEGDGEYENEDEEGEEEGEGRYEGEYLDSDSDLGDDLDAFLAEQQQFVEQEEEAPVTDEETRRLAVLNFDWESVRAVDLLVLLNSFLPPKGLIKSVKIYPSEYGLEMMAKEEQEAPAIFAKKGPRNKPKSTLSSTAHEDIQDGINQVKLRAYERSKYKYYFAVVECDNAKTAVHLYEQLDGMDLENTAIPTDVRFIPDHHTFTQQIRDEASSVPVSYEAPDLWSKGLSHTRVECTWDTTPLMRRIDYDPYSKDAIKEMKFNDFLANMSDSDHENDPEKIKEKRVKTREKYAMLLEGIDKEDKVEELDVTFAGFGEEMGGAESDDGGEGSDSYDSDTIDKEITFTPGLSGVAEGLVQSKSAKDGGVWQEYLLRRQEKQKEMKKAKSERRKGYIDQQRELLKGDVKGKSKTPEPPSAEILKQKAQLELITANIEKRKQNKSVDITEESREDEGDFKINTKDSRFQALFTSSEFALDPTHPKFKKTNNMETILIERQKRRLEEIEKPQKKKLQPSSQPQSRPLSDLVQSVKQKASNFSQPPKFNQPSVVKKARTK